MEKRAVVEEGRTPPADTEKKASSAKELDEGHVQRKVEAEMDKTKLKKS